MNWLRDNILKILIILGVTILVVVLIVVFAKPKGESIESAAKYGELETKLQNAAIKYSKRNKSVLPKTTDNVATITLETLEKNNYIGKLVAVEDNNVKCSGYVEVAKISEKENSYRYTPYISCDKYYVTKTIGDYIIDSETKNGEFDRQVDDGLYKMGEEYIYRGEKPNNYIMLDSHLYRIIKIDSDKSLELISVDRTYQHYIWDDRYNIDRNMNNGINNFLKSRLYESLDFLYKNTDEDKGEIFFSSEEKNYIIDHDFCIGKRAFSDGSIYSGAECKETASLMVGLISLNEYSRASIDPNCKSVFDKSCANYNYFITLGDRDDYTYLTLTAVADNTYQYFRIGYGEVTETVATTGAMLYPVIYISNRTIYSSGTGTVLDPYVVR